MSGTQTQRTTLKIGHSPDPDDAFMWYPLANFLDGSGPGGQTITPAIDTGEYDFVHILEDIQSLNERAEKAELEITAISIHQYPYVAKDYALTSCGASMGDGYGPMVIGSHDVTMTPENFKGKKIAIPGERTSAWLALQLYMKTFSLTSEDVQFEVVMFDEIIERVASGEFDLGLIIHEGQLTYRNQGLFCLIDLGKWWKETRNGLPLPLGGNCIRRDMAGKMPEICTILLNSIRHALEHRNQAIDFAMNYARDMGHELADQFVGMYVNDWTLDYGSKGEESVRQFLKESYDAGLIPDPGEVDFIHPA